MRPNYSLKFYLYQKASKKNEFPIYARIIIYRRKAEFFTNQLINPNDWDSINGKHTKENHSVNEELTKLKSRIIEVMQRLDFDNKPISAKIVKEVVTGKEKIDPFIIEYFDKYLDRIKRGKEHASSSIQLYTQTRNKVKEFLTKIIMEKDYFIKNINLKFLNDLDEFLITYPLHRNTVNKHHSRFRTILLRAYNEEYIRNKPYDRFKLKFIETNPTFLEMDEIIKIMEHDLGGFKSLDKARDIFLFTVFSGIRFQAAQDLTVDQVKIDKEGNYYVEYNPGKQKMGNKKTSIHPLLGPALYIFHKYQNGEGQIIEKVLPELRNGTINKHLKVIADLVGIEKNLHHHVARHTFATTILLENGVPLKTVSIWMSHSGTKMTEHYAKVSVKSLLNSSKLVNNAIRDLNKYRLNE